MRFLCGEPGQDCRPVYGGFLPLLLKARGPEDLFELSAELHVVLPKLCCKLLPPPSPFSSRLPATLLPCCQGSGQRPRSSPSRHQPELRFEHRESLGVRSCDLLYPKVGWPASEFERLLEFLHGGPDFIRDAQDLEKASPTQTEVASVATPFRNPPAPSPCARHCTAQTSSASRHCWCTRTTG